MTPNLHSIKEVRLCSTLHRILDTPQQFHPHLIRTITIHQLNLDLLGSICPLRLWNFSLRALTIQTQEYWNTWNFSTIIFSMCSYFAIVFPYIFFWFGARVLWNCSVLLLCILPSFTKHTGSSVYKACCSGGTLLHVTLPMTVLNQGTRISRGAARFKYSTSSLLVFVWRPPKDRVRVSVHKIQEHMTHGLNSLNIIGRRKRENKTIHMEKLMRVVK